MENRHSFSPRSPRGSSYGRSPRRSHRSVDGRSPRRITHQRVASQPFRAMSYLMVKEPNLVGNRRLESEIAEEKDREQINARHVVDEESMLQFSKKPRLREYRPYSLKDYKSHFPAQYQELPKGLQPDLNRTELVQKKKAINKRKEYAEKIRRQQLEKLQQQKAKQEQAEVAAQRELLRRRHIKPQPPQDGTSQATGQNTTESTHYFGRRKEIPWNEQHASDQNLERLPPQQHFHTPPSSRSLPRYLPTERSHLPTSQFLEPQQTSPQQGMGTTPYNPHNYGHPTAEASPWSPIQPRNMHEARTRPFFSPHSGVQATVQGARRELAQAAIGVYEDPYQYYSSVAGDPFPGADPPQDGSPGGSRYMPPSVVYSEGPGLGQGPYRYHHHQQQQQEQQQQEQHSAPSTVRRYHPMHEPKQWEMQSRHFPHPPPKPLAPPELKDFYHTPGPSYAASSTAHNGLHYASYSEEPVSSYVPYMDGAAYSSIPYSDGPVPSYVPYSDEPVSSHVPYSDGPVSSHVPYSAGPVSSYVPYSDGHAFSSPPAENGSAYPETQTQYTRPTVSQYPRPPAAQSKDVIAEEFDW